MKPTTDLGELARVVHADTYPGHDFGECGCPEWVLRQDQDQAQRYLDLLEGWHLAPSVSLPRSVPAGREGSLDLTDFMEQVLWVVVAHGPIATEPLNIKYEGYSERLPHLFPKRGHDTPRKRLTELEAGGFVCKSLGPDGKQLTWHGYGVWEATEKGRQRCPSFGRAAA